MPRSVTFIEPWPPFNAGETASVGDATAMVLVNTGLARYAGDPAQPPAPDGVVLPALEPDADDPATFTTGQSSSGGMGSMGGPAPEAGAAGGTEGAPAAAEPDAPSGPVGEQPDEPNFDRDPPAGDIIFSPRNP